MVFSRPEEEGRALAYAGSILFSLGLAVFSAVMYAFRALVRSAKNRSAETWPTAPGRITTSDVRAIHGRLIDYAIATIGYAYEIEGGYYSGYLLRQFWDEQRAWTFADSCRDRPVLIRHKLGSPQISVLRDLESAGAVYLDRRSLRPAAQFGPGVAILWALRNVSDWAEARLHRQAKSWPSASANVKYAEPRIVDDDAHWVGELRYRYSVDGISYSASHYFRVYGEADAREQVEPWRNCKVIVHYYSGNPARSIFIPEEQDESAPIPQTLG